MRRGALVFRAAKAGSETLIPPLGHGVRMNLIHADYCLHGMNEMMLLNRSRSDVYIIREMEIYPKIPDNDLLINTHSLPPLTRRGGLISLMSLITTVHNPWHRKFNPVFNAVNVHKEEGIIKNRFGFVLREQLPP